MSEQVHTGSRHADHPYSTADRAGGGSSGRTGDAVVDAALDLLDTVPQAGLDQQERALVEVHDVLRQRLSSSQS